MEVLIFGIAGLVMLAVFLALSLLPAYIAYRIGRLSGVASLSVLLPVLAVVGPIVWALTGYDDFKAGCKSVQAPVFFGAPPSPPEGLLLDAPHVDRFDLIERGLLSFVDSPQGGPRLRHDFLGEKRYPNSPISVETRWVAAAESQAEYVVTEQLEKTQGNWWKAASALYTLEVRERASGRLLAKSSDLVFGGGILGRYLRIFGGDQDFEHLSCGYASRGIGAWRPGLTSRPRFAQYRTADAVFLARALNLRPGSVKAKTREP